jgi:hypothetical protein
MLGYLFAEKLSEVVWIGFKFKKETSLFPWSSPLVLDKFEYYRKRWSLSFCCWILVECPVVKRIREKRRNVTGRIVWPDLQ